jgi:hypothetical protein
VFVALETPKPALGSSPVPSAWTRRARTFDPSLHEIRAAALPDDRLGARHVEVLFPATNAPEVVPFESTRFAWMLE